MPFYKIFANIIHKDPPFRNPYIYLKQEEFIKLQKQKGPSETKLPKETKKTEELMHNQIISALDNLSNAVASKQMSYTRKKLIKKKEGLIEIIFPFEPNICNKEPSKNLHIKERRNQGLKESKGLLRFVSSYLSKSTINSCLTSLCTKDSSGSEYTDSTTRTYNNEARNKCDEVDTSSTSICSSVEAIKSKGSVIFPSDAAAKLEITSCHDFSATSHCIPHLESNNGSALEDNSYPIFESSSTSSIKTASLPLNLTAFSTEQNIAINSNMRYSTNPFIKTIFMTDTILNYSTNTYLNNSISTGSFSLDSHKFNRYQNYDFAASNIAFFSTKKAKKFYNKDGSIVLPKANYTSSQLSSFRKRYHSYSVSSNCLRLDSLRSNESDIEPMKIPYNKTEKLIEIPRSKIQTCCLICNENKNIQYLNNIGSNCPSKHVIEFESSSVYDSESDMYILRDHLMI